MSLDAILNDINDGVTDGITPIDGVGDIPNVSLENIRGVVVVSSTNKINLPKLESSLVDKFNNLYRICTLKQTVKDLKIVDRNIVMEGLAALPERSPIHEAKLTTGASAINKKILDDIVFSGKDEMPADLVTYIHETFSVLNETVLREIDDLISTITTFADEIRPMIQSKFKTAIVMFNNQSYNLLTDDLSTVAFSLDDTKLMYDKYSGQLNNRAKEIFSAGLTDYIIGISDISDNVEGKDTSVVGIIGTVSYLEAYLRGIKSTIEEFLASAKYYIDKNDPNLTGAAADVVERLPSAIVSVDNFNRIRDIISDDFTLFKCVNDYVQFVD